MEDDDCQKARPLSLSYRFKLLTHNRLSVNSAVNISSESGFFIAATPFGSAILHSGVHYHLLGAAAVNMVRMGGNLRQPTSRIVTVDGSSPVYIFISKLGSVGIFNTKLRCQKTYVTAVQERTKNGSGSKQRTDHYVTDCIFMPNCMKLVIATTARTLHFYDISASIHIEEFRLSDLPSAPSCLAYWFDSAGEEPSLLLAGLDNGNIVVFCFHQSDFLLFRKADLTQTEMISFQNMELHEMYVEVRVIPSIHKEPIHRIQYIERQESAISCSDDPESSVSIYDITGKRKNYIFKLLKGVRCFDVCHEQAIFVTGGLDGVVRIWNLYVTCQPTGILKGHEKSILDLKLYKEKKYVFSFSEDAVFKVWSWDNWNCLQSVFLSFPVFSVLGHDPEFGKFPLHISPDRHSIIVTYGEWATRIQLSKINKEQNMPKTKSGMRIKATAGAKQEAYVKLEPQDGGSSLALNETFPTLSGPIWEKKGYSLAKVRETRRLLTSILSPAPNNESLKNTEHGKTIAPREPEEKNEAEEKMMRHLFEKLRVRSGASAITREKMRQTVWDGGPHWTLQILPLKEITFPEDLPMSTRMHARRLVCRTGADLLAMNLSAASLELPLGLTWGGRGSRRSSLTSISSYRSKARSVASMKSSVGLFAGISKAANPTPALPPVFEFPLPEIRLPE